MTRKLKITKTVRITKTGAVFCVDDPSAPGSPPVGYGTTIVSAIGSWVINNQESQTLSSIPQRLLRLSNAADNVNSSKGNLVKQRRVVCAALRADDGSLVLGIRHYSADMLAQLHNMGQDASKFYHRSGDDQGFVDQHGVYMTRREAYIVAQEAGQIVYPEACTHNPSGSRLYSEGLY